MTTPRVAAVLAAVVALAACSAADRPGTPAGASTSSQAGATVATATVALGATIPMTVTTATPPTATVGTVDRKTRYIEALRAARVPETKGNQTELAVAEGVCQQVAQGADPAKLAADLVAGNLYTTAQAQAVVDAARTHYCE